MTQQPARSRVRRTAAFLARNDRFLDTANGLRASFAYLLLTASYLQARLTDDGPIYYDFMRRLVGEDVEAYAYQFGVVFWNLPFYVLSRPIRIGNDNDWVDHVLIGAVGVAIASVAAVVVLFYVSWRLIRNLGLPGGPGAILLTVLGSPLFYYAIFQTGLKHAFDTLLVSVLALLLLHLSVHPATTRVAVALGLVVALLISVRYANIVLLTGVIYVFVRRRAYSQGYVATRDRRRRGDVHPGAAAAAGHPVRAAAAGAGGAPAASSRGRWLRAAAAQPARGELPSR